MARTPEMRLSICLSFSPCPSDLNTGGMSTNLHIYMLHINIGSSLTEHLAQRFVLRIQDAWYAYAIVKYQNSRRYYGRNYKQRWLTNSPCTLSTPVLGESLKA